MGHGPENRQTAWVPRLFKCAAWLPVSVCLPLRTIEVDNGIGIQSILLRLRAGVLDLLAVCSTQQGHLTRRWIQSTFPHKDHRLLNEAIPATTSSYIAPCVLNMVPETVDLVVMVSLLPGSPCQVPDLDLTWDFAWLDPGATGLLGPWRCSRPYDSAASCRRSSPSMMGSAQRQTPWRTPQGRHASS